MGDELERRVIGGEMGEVEDGMGIENGEESEMMKVEWFGEDVGRNEDVGVGVLKMGDDRVVGGGCGGGDEWCCWGGWGLRKGG